MTVRDPILSGLRVLIAEDQYMIAAELRRVLERLGVVVIGPCSDVDQALAALTQPIDLALLDVNLHGYAVFPVADALAGLGIPYAFATAYEVGVLPPPYQSVPRVEKPVEPEVLVKLLRQLARGRIVASS